MERGDKERKTNICVNMATLSDQNAGVKVSQTVKLSVKQHQYTDLSNLVTFSDIKDTNCHKLQEMSKEPITRIIQSKNP